MRKYIFIMVSILCLASCKWHRDYCHHCGQYFDCCRCNQYYHSYYAPKDDGFTAKTLIGVWQANYSYNYEKFLGFTPKQFNFVNERYCDITYSVGSSSDWYTETYTYSYSSGYIKFARNGKTFSFKINEFIYPTLTLSDSHGKYEWYKKQ